MGVFAADRGTTNLRPYKYDPIMPALARSSIRLLNLLPGERGTQLCCTLEIAEGLFEPRTEEAEEHAQHVSHDEGGTHQLTYEALSYVWGDPSVTVPIVINGCELLITTNLERFLQRLRRADEMRVLWADAICIDQTNVEERSSQVNLMADIYRSAEKVLIWLGEEDEHTGTAFTTVKKLSVWAALQDGDTIAELAAEDSDFARPGVIASLKFEFSDLTMEQINAIQSTFFERSWWTRIWTVQEATLSREAALMCGSFILPWSVGFLLLESYLERPRNDLNTAPSKVAVADLAYNALTPWTNLHLMRSLESDRRGLHQIWHTIIASSYRPRRCTDPRDLLYGILSLVEFKGVGITPDYTKSISVVFTELTRALIRDTRDLSSICVRALPEWKGKLVPFNWLAPKEVVPSWVPDYCCIRYSSIVKDAPRDHPTPEVFKADGRIKLNLDTALGASDNLLQLQCSSWDIISYATHMFPADGSNSTMETRSAIAQGWKKAMDGLKYPTGEDMPAVFYRTLRRDVQRHNGKMERLDDSITRKHKVVFDAWYNENPPNIERYRVNLDETRQRVYSEDEDSDNFEQGFQQSMLDLFIDDNATFFMTTKGYMGIVDGLAQIGDEVCIVYGSCVPLILRPAGQTFEGKLAPIPELGFHTLVGAAYVHGIMDGEVMNSTNLETANSCFLI